MENGNLEHFDKALIDALIAEGVIVDEGTFKNFLGSALAGLSLASGIGAAAAQAPNQRPPIVLPQVPDAWKQPPVQQVNRPSLPKVPTTVNTTQATTLKKEKASSKSQVIELAQLIYAEAGPNTTDKDMKLICQVIMNRVGKKAFRNLTTKKVSQNAWDVIADKKSFNAYYDDKNSSWADFDKVRQKMIKNEKLNAIEKNVEKKIRLAVAFATAMLNNDTTFLNDLSADEKTAVYYHDTSITKPKGWTNTTEISTTGTSGKLKFYSWQGK